MCMKIKVILEGSLRNMFLLISTVPEKVSTEEKHSWEGNNKYITKPKN